MVWVESGGVLTDVLGTCASMVVATVIRFAEDRSSASVGAARKLAVTQVRTLLMTFEGSLPLHEKQSLAHCSTRWL